MNPALILTTLQTRVSAYCVKQTDPHYISSMKTSVSSVLWIILNYDKLVVGHICSPGARPLPPYPPAVFLNKFCFIGWVVAVAALTFCMLVFKLAVCCIVKSYHFSALGLQSYICRPLHLYKSILKHIWFFSTTFLPVALVNPICTVIRPMPPLGRHSHKCFINFDSSLVDLLDEHSTCFYCMKILCVINKLPKLQ